MMKQDKRETKATSIALGKNPPERMRERVLWVEVSQTRIELSFSLTRCLREVQ